MQETRENMNRLFLPECSIDISNGENKPVLKDSSFIRNEGEGYGYKNLNDIELLSAISGVRPDLASEILHQYKLHEIEDYLEGLNPRITAKQKKAILSAFELSRRIYGRSAETQRIIKSPQDVIAFLDGDMRYLKKEIFVCIHLNTKNAVLRKETISIGSLNASIVHPREVFSNAVKHSVSAVILCHNHPSGDPDPSSEDIETTRRLIDAGNILGIKVLDHIIIGNGKYVSLKEKGLI